ncbi:hypothetical protein [Corynebacterium sp.]|uniref:hypothetical protein n=1 Tax=Corynebacterium sp. TaxID=1720 RepID=UPI0026DBF770|nr:hypothetical protein [Corynebacterium sp.]MDO5032511.1 hypothetical protein [Corynebacterium sp.]
MLDVSTDLSMLMTDQEWEEALPELPARLRAGGVEPVDINAELVVGGCQPGSVLVDEYVAKHGTAPAGEKVRRVIVNAASELPLHKVTMAVAECFPPHVLWLGSTEIGHTELGLGSTTAWRAQD